MRVGRRGRIWFLIRMMFLAETFWYEKEEEEMFWDEVEEIEETGKNDDKEEKVEM